MTTGELILDLCGWIKTLPKPKNEAQLHAGILQKLQTMNLSLVDKGRIPNPGASGVSRPDLRVTGVNPQLLIEIKVNGGWKCASQAAWQLFQAGELLQKDGVPTRKLAIFGGKISDSIMPKMLEVLDIEWGSVEV